MQKKHKFQWMVLSAFVSRAQTRCQTGLPFVPSAFHFILMTSLRRV